MKPVHYLLIMTVLSAIFVPRSSVWSQTTINLKASDALVRTELSFSPRSGTFLDGSTFEAPLYLDTKGKSINAVDIRIKFNPEVISIVNPSGGKSIIGMWVEPPTYDNTKGTARIVGTIPDGIVTNSGLIATFIFRAKSPGSAIVTISDASQVLLNDGSGTPTAVTATRAVYTISPRPPEGVPIYSETHPFQDKWYNNNSPSFSWDKEPGVTGFSFTLDNKPTTIPSNNPVDETIKSYPTLADGVWYFHLKALKAGVWGSTTHFMVKIDTAPPAQFTPTLEYLGAAVINRFLVSFFTTDNLSGIDHYEVGIIDKNGPLTEAPVFVQTESPYQLPFDRISSASIIVRAFDRAGNIRDVSVNAKAPFVPLKLIVDNAVMILLIILGIIIITFITHYFYGHKIIRRVEKNVARLEPPQTPPPSV